MNFDYSKLLGRIKECGYTQETLADEIGMASSSLSLKLNNRAHFKQRDIRKIANVLDLSEKEVGSYFFAEKVQKN